MISFFPFSYPDELLYSQLCRYHIRSGNLTYTMSAKDLYAHRNVVPDTLFLNRFNEDSLAWICGDCGLDSVIEKRTMFPAIARFLPRDRRKEAFNALVSMEGNWNNLLRISNAEARTLRFCPICAKEDRSTFGETYYHRHHQIYRLELCPKHGCFLEDAKIITSKTSPGFYDAESYVPINTEPRYSDDETEIRLAEYIINVFDAPVDLISNYPIGYFLNSHISSKYVNKSGLVRNISELYEDYKNYFNNKGTLELQQLQKILNGYKFDNYNICQFSMFLGLSEKELTNMPTEMVLIGIEALYKSLALQFDIEYEVVHHIADEILKYTRGRTYLARKCGPHERAWAELDNTLFPKVKEFVESTLNKEGRPIKISTAMVQKALDLPQKQLTKLPQCFDYIKSKMETYPEFWAREIVWAAGELEAAGKEVTRNAIAKKLSLTNNDITACMKYIDDDNLKKSLQRIRQFEND